MVFGRYARQRLIVGAVVGLVLAGLAVLAGPAGPATAAPSAPVNLTASNDPVPVLSWDAVTGATGYVVQGSENQSFSPTVFSQSTVNTSYVPVRVLKEGSLFWRVQAVDGSGSSPFSNVEETDIETHEAPTGLTVEAGSGGTILPPVSPPIVSWDAVAGATGYDVEVDDEGDGVGGTVRYNLKTTTYVVPDPQGVGETAGTADFCVRVRAKFPNNLQTDWTPYVSYDVTQLAAVTSAVCTAGMVCAPAPDPGVRPSRTVQDVVFDWDPVAGAKEYEIWVALNSDFTTQVERRPSSAPSTRRRSPTTTTTTSGRSGRSTRRTSRRRGRRAPSEFQRRWPDKPTPGLAAGDRGATTVGDDFYLQWTPVQHAAVYQLDVGHDPNFTPGTFETCFTGQTTYTGGYKRTTSACRRKAHLLLEGEGP